MNLIKNNLFREAFKTNSKLGHCLDAFQTKLLNLELVQTRGRVGVSANPNFLYHKFSSKFNWVGKGVGVMKRGGRGAPDFL